MNANTARLLQAIEEAGPRGISKDALDLMNGGRCTRALIYNMRWRDKVQVRSSRKGGQVRYWISERPTPARVYIMAALERAGAKGVPLADLLQLAGQHAVFRALTLLRTAGEAFSHRQPGVAAHYWLRQADMEAAIAPMRAAAQAAKQARAEAKARHAAKLRAYAQKRAQHQAEVDARKAARQAAQAAAREARAQAEAAQKQARAEAAAMARQARTLAKQQAAEAAKAAKPATQRRAPAATKTARTERRTERQTERRTTPAAKGPDTRPVIVPEGLRVTYLPHQADTRFTPSNVQPYFSRLRPGQYPAAETPVALAYAARLQGVA